MIPNPSQQYTNYTEVSPAQRTWAEASSIHLNYPNFSLTLTQPGYNISLGQVKSGGRN